MKRAKRIIGVAVVIIFLGSLLMPFLVRIEARAEEKRVVVSNGPITFGIQNGIFGSRFNMNFHFDPGRRKCWTSSLGAMMDDAVSFFPATRLDSDGSVMRMGPSDHSFPEYKHYVLDLNANTFEANAAHVVGDRIVLSVNSKLKNHFFKVANWNEEEVKDLVAPFFYQEVTIENYTESPQTGELLFVLDYAVDYKKIGDTNILYFQTPNDNKGIRALALKAEATWGIGDGIFDYFKNTGSLPCGRVGSQNWHAGGFAIPFVLAPHQKVKKVLVYAAYYGGNALFDKRIKKGLRFYYTNFFSNVEEVIDYAFCNYERISKKADEFSQGLRTGNYVLDFITSQAIHSYMGNTWLVYDPSDGTPRYYVSEGNCQFLSTVDVAYETAVFEAKYMPWALKLQLEEWSEYVRYDGYGAYLQHDMGFGRNIEPSQAYPGDMKAEEIVDYILILFLYWKKTGDIDFVKEKMPLVREFVNSLKRRDTNGNGIVDQESGYTTYDYDWGYSALGWGKENVYLGIKEFGAFLAAEKMEKAIGSQNSYYDLAKRISDTLKDAYKHFGYLPVSLDASKPGWNDQAIINFEGLLYFIITGTEDPLIDDLLCTVSPSHYFALQNCKASNGWRLTSSTSATWLSKVLDAKIINDYFIVKGFYSFEDTIISDIERMIKKSDLGWIDYWNVDGTSVTLCLYPRGVSSIGIINFEYLVELEYKTWLHRAPDPGGKAFQIHALCSGTTINQLTQNFRHSSEYVWEAPFEINGVKCRGYVDFAFVYWFGHHQDKEGHDMYCNLITSWQWSDSDVWWEFYRASVIYRVYRELLDREPDPSGFACYMEHMRSHGWTEAQVRQSIMDSPEYKQKHPNR